MISGISRSFQLPPLRGGLLLQSARVLGYWILCWPPHAARSFTGAAARDTPEVDHVDDRRRLLETVLVAYDRLAARLAVDARHRVGVGRGILVDRHRGAGLAYRLADARIVVRP